MSRLKAHPGESSRLEEERLMLSGGVNMVVVLELCQWEEVRPVILTLIDKEAEVLFKLLIHPFGLAITL